MVLSNFPRVIKNLPLASFVVASTALCFQVGVLYPWHHTLSNQLETLSKEVDKKANLNTPVVLHQTAPIIPSSTVMHGTPVHNSIDSSVLTPKTL